MIQAYVFMGSTGSGRRSILSDLLSWSLQSEAAAGTLAVVLADGEKESDVDAELAKSVPVLKWSAEGELAVFPEIPEGVETLFIMLNGSSNPSDQMEKLAAWFSASDKIELARIVTILNSRLLSDKPELGIWFDACVHFSDIVIFSRREGVSNKWFSDYRKRFEKKCYPCLFTMEKGGKVANPAEILCPEARRMSLAFDFSEDDDRVDVSNLPVEIMDETDDLDADQEDDDLVEPEPYFERDAAGRRKIRLPDISAYLS